VNHRLVFLGPPASGKGTVAAVLSRLLGVPHVSTGQMFRQAVQKGGPAAEAAREFIEKGQLVPDPITMQIVRQWLDESGGGDGFILDGFPRTLPQALGLDRLLQERNQPLTHAVLLDLDDEDCVARGLGRMSCEKCGTLYHVTFVPPRRDGVCDACGGRLQRRADDNERTVRERLEIYRQQTLQVVGHYEKRRLLRRVDARLPKEQVLETVLKLVQT
jgi:adenylate kinase